MSFDVLTNSNPYGLRKGERLTFAYPTGRTAASYNSTGASLILPGGISFKQADAVFFVTYGPSNISVHYGNGPTVASGTVTLRAPLAAGEEVASGVSVVTLTQAAYSALTSPDSNTLYVIVG